MNKKILQTLGLCMRAGMLCSGDLSVMNAIRSGSAKLVILAENASENTKKKLKNSTEFYSVQLIVWGDKFITGAALGKDERAVVAVTDSAFCKKIIDMIDLETDK